MARWVWLVAAVVIAAALATVYVLAGPSAQTTLTFEVRDAVSRSAVWDSTIRLQDRVIRGYSTTSFRFTRLRPGTFDLTVSSPYYEPAVERVTLRRGRTNTVPPINLTGYRIPGLAQFAAAADRVADGLELSLNPLDAGGKLIRVFPCVDLRVVARVSVQTKGGRPVSAPTREGAERGTTLFEGAAGWSWNAAPDALYRYQALIAPVSEGAARYVVIDYAVIVPDPRRITTREVDAFVTGMLRLHDPSALDAYVRPYLDRVRIESGTQWNVPNFTDGAGSAN